MTKDYAFLETVGALCDGDYHRSSRSERRTFKGDVTRIPEEVISLVSEDVARSCRVIPVEYDGECVTLICEDEEDIAKADHLRFALAKDVELVQAEAHEIELGLELWYTTDVGEVLTACMSNLCLEEPALGATRQPAKPNVRKKSATLKLSTGSHNVGLCRTVSSDLCEVTGMEDGMFHTTVQEGRKVLVHHKDGSLSIETGPTRFFNWGKRCEPLLHHVAYPGEFLRVRHKDGRQDHLVGPCELWQDPRIHAEVKKELALELAAKQAVVVYRNVLGKDETARRIVHGPGQFVPKPGEWLHTFSWHASEGGSKGVKKVPKGLVFQKLSLMPDQMYHDVEDVRTSDDAVLTIRLMIFFELVNIERMLDHTHDPIGDFVNAATSDVVDFTGRHDFESFKQNTNLLNELETYKQLVNRAEKSGYRINKVVYRGYGAAESLQQMHNQAIEARTRLQLQRATEEQSQHLENYKLECQLERAAKRRDEQQGEIRQQLALAEEKTSAKLKRDAAHQEHLRQQRQADAALNARLTHVGHEQDWAHLTALRELGVDLTQYLTQARADRVIEFRGDSNNNTHVHLEKLEAAGE